MRKLRKLLTVGTEFYTKERLYRKVFLGDNKNDAFVTKDKDGTYTGGFESIEKLTDFYYDEYGVSEVIKYGDSDEKELFITTDEIGKAVVYELAKDGRSLPFSTVQLIEKAVFELLVEKGIMEEQK